MKIIKLTNLDKESIFVNVECIGHIYRVEKERPAFTRVGTTTHNNGGFKVTESPEAIIKLIETSRGV